MSLEAWNILWQLVVAGTCVAFFGLAAGVTLGAIREAREMFRDLLEEGDQPPVSGRS